MNIQWYPGHMAKTKRLLAEQLRWVDVVIELGDARLPLSSRNPLLPQLLGSKSKLLILNKSDLADPLWTKRWLTELRKASPVIALSAASGEGVSQIMPNLNRLVAAKMAGLKAKGVRSRTIRVMVAGIPNIGKSTLINQLTGGAQAKTGNKPGVTRGNQWIRIHDLFDLLDTPGLLWPKFDDQEVGYKLAAVGSISDDVFDLQELSAWLLDWLYVHYPQAGQRYNVGNEKISLEAIGRARGCLLQGGRIDTLKAAQILLREFRQGNLGRITMDLLEPEIPGK
ncbi:MAG TPA: ribosome biogenesis GTPase YlqF [Desulfitobacteriaceae bacterium]|nr:ribosome biogenesis GTPase YlqF [Desulfitobacteriaceae bacterium]